MTKLIYVCICTIKIFFGRCGYWNCPDSQFHVLLWCHRSVMIKALDCGTVVSEFELLHSLSDKYSGGKGMNYPYPPNYELNSTTIVLLEG